MQVPLPPEPHDFARFFNRFVRRAIITLGASPRGIGRDTLSVKELLIMCNGIG
jgi:hypothetical protein